MADRGYEACNNLAHLERKGWNYLIRLRDKNRAVAYGQKLPDTAQFDIPVQITLGRQTARQMEQMGLVVPASYYRVPPQMTFDDLEPKSISFTALSFRIVRIETEKDASSVSGYAKGYVAYFAEEGIIGGYEDSTFKPKNNITREEAAKILAVALDLEVTGTPTFADTNKIAGWAKNYVYACVNAKMLMGEGNNTFNPLGSTIRAAAATAAVRVDNAK